MKFKIPADAIVYVTSDLYEAGRTCDGMPFIAETYRVTIELADGYRLSHGVSFPGCRVERDEEGEQYFVDTREEMVAKVEKLAKAIAAKGEADMQYWDAARPVYGSPAYQRDDAGFVAAELAADKRGQ